MNNIKSHKWFLVGLIAVLFAAPNAAIVKVGVASISPVLYNFMRFALVAVVTVPFLIKRRSTLTKQNVRYALISGVAMTVAVLSFITAIKLSQASYVSILTLITPIIFIIFSNKVTGERISKRALLGITLSAIGAMIIVLLPIAIRQAGEFVFYPAATGFALLNSLSFPVAIIYYKKANDAGMPMLSLLSVASWVVATASGLLLLVQIGVSGPLEAPTRSAVLAALYSGIIVATLVRALMVKSYEHIGAARTSALSYLETFLAILIPVIVLGENLSVEMVIGGITILLGVFIVEHHKSPHHKQHYIFKSH